MGCCLSIVILFLVIFAFVAYLWGILIALDVGLFIFVVSSAIRKSDAKKMKPSKMICPNCNGANVKLSNVKSGVTTNGSYRNGHGTKNTRIHYKRIAECKGCGYTWDYITKEDIDKEITDSNGAFGLGVVLLVIAVIVTAWIFG